MQDRQIEAGPIALRIPILSPLLHCISMTVLVYLRSSFGFVFLRPKSVFFAFSWAMTLFLIYAWNELTVWAEYGFTAVFGMGAVGLYWLHLIIAFGREIYRTGEHDHDSGTPHVFRVFKAERSTILKWKLWAEPILILLIAMVLKVGFHERHLSSWLFMVAPCLWLKEALNFWFQLRQKKRHQDSQDDAVDIFEDVVGSGNDEAPMPSRKDRVARQRLSRPPAERLIMERQMAQLLELKEPYSLAEAEQNYRRLIKECHPDSPANEESGSRAAALNEAIEFFRRRLASQKV